MSGKKKKAWWGGRAIQPMTSLWKHHDPSQSPETVVNKNGKRKGTGPRNLFLQSFQFSKELGCNLHSKGKFSIKISYVYMNTSQQLRLLTHPSTHDQ